MAHHAEAISMTTTEADGGMGHGSDHRKYAIALYNATKGPVWKINGGWKMIEGHLDDWYGVDADLNGRITKLDLSENNLEGFIPKTLGHLSTLQELFLPGNKLSGPIPRQLGDLRALERLVLRDNNLDGPIPPYLGRLRLLRRLDFSYNRFTGPIPAELGDLLDLTILYLQENHLTGQLPPQLKKLQNLKEINLAGNGLSEITKDAAQALCNVPRCTLRGNPWTIPPAKILAQGLKHVVRYLEDAQRSGVTESWKLKVVVVGAVKAGKTSLVRGMLSGYPQLCAEDGRTRGVDVCVEQPCKPDPSEKLELVFWDFAGHCDYYTTHQLFLSEGALHLLVVDLKRFSDEPMAEKRGDLVHVWLDALQSRVPGSGVLVLGTQVDRMDNYEDALERLGRAVQDHLAAKRVERERARAHCSTNADKRPDLVFLGCEPVSAADTSSLRCLRERLVDLVLEKKAQFPSVGQVLPVSWARASAVLSAMRTGSKPVSMAKSVHPPKMVLPAGVRRKKVTSRFRIDRVLVGGLISGATTSNPEKIESEESPKASPLETHMKKGVVISIRNDGPVQFIRWEDALSEWDEVVLALDLESEIEPGDTRDVFRAAVRLQEAEGSLLDSGELLHLDPTWLNQLFWAILDHRLSDPEMVKFWEGEILDFVNQHSCKRLRFKDIMRIHDNFCSTGTLTIGYLRFLWRTVAGIDDEGTFGSLLNTMSHYGVVFESDRSPASREDADFFVPVRLPDCIIYFDLKECEERRLEYQYRKELVYEIVHTYVPPGLLGLLVARFLKFDEVRLTLCWRHGATFAIGGPEALLYLNAPGNHGERAEVAIHVFGQQHSDALHNAVNLVQSQVEELFDERFAGLVVKLRGGKPLSVCGRDAVLDKIDGLQIHIDTSMSRLVQGVGVVEDKLDVLARSCRECLARLVKLQAKDVPFPSLVVVRPASAVIPGKQRRSLRARLAGMRRRARNVAIKEWRLLFLCPFDHSEVPCGLDGNGYPFAVTRRWVKAILPVLQVTAVLAKVAIKAASGLVIQVPEFLFGVGELLGEELADRLLDENMLERALKGGAGGVNLEAIVGDSYEELKKFLATHKCEGKDRCTHFDTLMERVDDGKGGLVWMRRAVHRLAGRSKTQLELPSVAVG